jgi:hypothetical protein
MFLLTAEFLLDHDAVFTFCSLPPSYSLHVSIRHRLKIMVYSASLDGDTESEFSFQLPLAFYPPAIVLHHVSNNLQYDTARQRTELSCYDVISCIFRPSMTKEVHLESHE